MTKKLDEKSNSGNYNSGYSNSGNYNSGNYNSGYSNSGNYNSGNFNSGYYNSGNYNSGNYNSGYSNSGNSNSGNFNSGYYNSGNFNSGFFNTNEPNIRLFNKDSGIKLKDLKLPYLKLKVSEFICETKMSNQEKKDYPNFYVTKGYTKTRTYKEAFKLEWDKLKQEEKQMFLDLPNFCPDIFLEITGIDVKTNSCSGKIVEIDGKKYKLTEVL